jgi:hypothetical protein
MVASERAEILQGANELAKGSIMALKQSRTNVLSLGDELRTPGGHVVTVLALDVGPDDLVQVEVLGYGTKVLFQYSELGRS